MLLGKEKLDVGTTASFELGEPFIPKEVTPWFTAFNAYSKLVLNWDYRDPVIEAFHTYLNKLSAVTVFVSKGSGQSLISRDKTQLGVPWRKGGEGEGIAVRHGGIQFVEEISRTIQHWKCA